MAPTLHRSTGEMAILRRAAPSKISPLGGQRPALTSAVADVFALRQYAVHGPKSVRRRSVGAGFTLIELLVAIAIMAVMTLVAWRGLDGMSRATQSTRTHTDAVLTLEAGLAQWGADLDAMVAPSAQPGAPLAMDWDGRALRITRRNATEPGSGLLVVAWTRGNRDGTEQWLRWQSAPLRVQQDWQTAWELSRQWAQSPSDSAKKQEVAILSIDQWQLYYYRGGAWSNPLSSSGAPAGGPAQPIPTNNQPDGVRLVLDIAAPHPLAGTLTRDWAQPTLTGSAP